MAREDLAERIRQYGGEIGVAFSMPAAECGADEILAIVDACREWDTHVGKTET